MKDKIREYLSFEGRVQGVGFRYRISGLARQYGMTGWVRNEYDGTVSAELQGAEEALQQILKELQEDRYIRVDRLLQKRIPVQQRESSFRIRY